jgi:hypothetical protein
MYKVAFLILVSFISIGKLFSQNRLPVDTTQSETNKQKALLYLDSVKDITQSIYWINVPPQQFLENVKHNIEKPLQLNAGRGTNFCAYAAVTYTCHKNESYRYAKTMIALYQNGFAKYRNINLKPSKNIWKAAGQIQFSGDLDKNFADQIWFLSLAHKFKGYLNIFNLHYQQGDENTLWAACNLAKFNRMLRRLCKYKVWSKGSDLIHPSIPDLIPFLQKKLQLGEVYLYWNNAILRKKNHDKFKKLIPTHFVVLQQIQENVSTGKVTIAYWDGGYKTVKEVELSTLLKTLYGVSWTKYANENEE